jgi:hypothetical protein
MNTQWYCQNESKAQEEINSQIYYRNVPSNNLQPHLDVRPVMTKYSYFQIVDPRKDNVTTLNTLPTYNISQTFNPGNCKAPWSGYASNVNTESELRNQIYALQKCSKSVYVPSSKSDLYDFSFMPTKKVKQSHELLFKNENFNNFNPNCYDNEVGYNMFNNSTRSQIKDLTVQPLPKINNYSSQNK